MANKKESIDEFLSNNVVVADKPAVNTEVSHEHNFNKAEAKRKGLVRKYQGEPKVAISISPFYKPYLGNVVRQFVNGIVVDVPCDGQTYYINETHASHIQAKIRRIDAMISRQQKAGDIRNNFEYSPGQLHI